MVRVILTVGIVYSTTHERVLEAIKILDGILAEHPEVSDRQVIFKNLSASSLDLEISFWTNFSTSVEYNQLLHSYNLEIKKRLDAAGISFAYPTQTIFLEKAQA